MKKKRITFDYLKEHFRMVAYERFEFDSIIRKDFPEFNLEHFLSFVEDNVDVEIDWIGVLDDIEDYHFSELEPYRTINQILNSEAFKR